MSCYRDKAVEALLPLIEKVLYPDDDDSIYLFDKTESSRKTAIEIVDNVIEAAKEAIREELAEREADKELQKFLRGE